MLKFNNSYGEINIVPEVVATIVGSATTKCFGVVGMAYKNATDGIVSLLKWENIEKGVNVTCTENEINIDIHIVVTYGVNIIAITESITHNVRYAVETATGFGVKKMNVYIDSIKNN